MQVRSVVSGFLTKARIDLDAITEEIASARKRKVVASTLAGFLTAIVLPVPDVAAAIEPSRYVPPVSSVSGFVTRAELPEPFELANPDMLPRPSAVVELITQFTEHSIYLSEIIKDPEQLKPSGLSGFITNIHAPLPDLAVVDPQRYLPPVGTLGGFITSYRPPSPVVLTPQLRLPPKSAVQAFITSFDGQSIILSELDDNIAIPEPSGLSGFVTEVKLPLPDLTIVDPQRYLPPVGTISGFITTLEPKTPVILKPQLRLPPKSAVQAFVTSFNGQTIKLTEIGEEIVIPEPSSLSGFVTDIELPLPGIAGIEPNLPKKGTLSGFITQLDPIAPIVIEPEIRFPPKSLVAAFVTLIDPLAFNPDPIDPPDYEPIYSTLSAFITDIELPLPEVLLPPVDIPLRPTISGFITTTKAPLPSGIGLPDVVPNVETIATFITTLARIPTEAIEELIPGEIPGTLSGFITEFDPVDLIPGGIPVPNVLPPIGTISGFITGADVPGLLNEITPNQPAFPPASNVILFFTQLLYEIVDINDIYPRPQLPEKVSMLSGFITRTFPNEVYNNVIDNLAEFLGGAGRYVRVFGNDKPVRGQPFRFRSYVSDWALNDGVPLTAPILEVSYFSGADKIIIHRSQMNSYETGTPLAVGSKYYMDVLLPTDKAIHSVEATVSIFPKVASELGQLLAQVIQATPPAIGAYVDLKKAALVTPQIDTMNLPLDTAQPKLDVIGMVTRGLLQFK